MYAHCRADVSLNHRADLRKITEPISFQIILINVAISASWPTKHIGVNDPQFFVFKEMGGVLRHSAPLLSSRFRDGITWKEDKTGCLSVLQPSKKKERMIYDAWDQASLFLDLEYNTYAGMAGSTVMRSKTGTRLMWNRSPNVPCRSGKSQKAQRFQCNSVITFYLRSILSQRFPHVFLSWTKCCFWNHIL